MPPNAKPGLSFKAAVTWRSEWFSKKGKLQGLALGTA